MFFNKLMSRAGRFSGSKRDTVLSFGVLSIALFTYLSTLEPTTSFWDCGEFITSSYKLEVGHPPGNPVFQLIARFFTLFGDKEQAAWLVNAMSGVCSAFTIYFLYLSLVLLGNRMLSGQSQTKEVFSGPERSRLVSGAALVGSLAYCFSDTFWFSAVEGEVYAMSSLFTAVVFWAMLKWETQADEPYSGRWIVFISFLMGVSIGVHLLNLLTIPVLGLIYYYKKYPVTGVGMLKALGVSGILLASILYGIIPYLPLAAAYMDLLFVNVLGAPVNLGAVLLVAGLLAGGFAGIYVTYRKGRVLWNTVLLSATMIVIGYSVFAVTVIRASTDTPTNEYQPDNPFTLIRYLAREQYGSYPLIYGESFSSKVVEAKQTFYYNYHDGKYIRLQGAGAYEYDSRQDMFFPRMWSGGSDSHVAFYKTNLGSHKHPSFGDNLRFFWDYQINFMYIRYFMWNFAGRQNDLHGTLPGDGVKGNWVSGIGFLDRMRLGNTADGPAYIVDSKARNHYYLLPLFLGLLGFFWQWRRDRQGGRIVLLLFFLTGLAIVVYLNQPPFQVRERDYAYAGSFYAFCIWIGMGVFPLAGGVKKLLGSLWKRCGKGAVCFPVLLGCTVPALMGFENWDDHDRSGRYTAREMAYNILMPLDPQAVLVVHSDNDTFPLWYLQGVEGVRPDVRIMNTSLLGMDWYIQQMRRKTYESRPVELSIDKQQYFYGTNDGVPVYERINRPVPAKEVIEIFRNPKIKAPSPFLRDNGAPVNYIAARQLVIPVDKEKVLRNGIVPACDADKIADSVVLTIPEDKFYLSKHELIILDMLARYQWDRPIYFLGAGDVNIGVKEWFQFEGFAYRFVPIKSDTGVYVMNTEQSDLDKVSRYIKEIYDWKTLERPGVNMDYQNLITFSAVMPPRQLMVTTAKGYCDKWRATGEEAPDEGVSVQERAEWRRRGVELLDEAFGRIAPENIPLSTLALDNRNDFTTCRAIEIYLAFGEREKGIALAGEYFTKVSEHFHLEGLEQSATECVSMLYHVLNGAGEGQLAEDYLKTCEKFFYK